MVGRVWTRPRLLPATMFAVAALLMVKAAGLVGAAYGAAEATAPAASAPSPDTPPAPSTAVPPAAHADMPVGEKAAGEKAAGDKGGGEKGVGEKGAGEKVGGEKAAGEPASDATPAHDKPAGETKPTEHAEAMPAPMAEPAISPSERALLVDLRKRRMELDLKAAALDQRETLLGAAEKRIALRVDELTSLQKRLEAMDAARRDRDEASWRGLVRVYETMKPKDAAVIFNDLDSTVLLQVVDRMKDGKAAAIMALMLPERARRLTTDLSTLRSRANAPPDPLAVPIAANDAGRPRPPAVAAPAIAPPAPPHAAVPAPAAGGSP